MSSILEKQRAEKFLGEMPTTFETQSTEQLLQRCDIHDNGENIAE